jgi:tetratricopeptide (TPR) repeat protein
MLPLSLCEDISDALLLSWRADKTILMSRLWYILVFLCALWVAPSRGQNPATDVTATDSSLSHARQLMQQGMYDEAVAELQKLSSAQPGMKRLAREFGIAYYKKSDYAQAITSFKQALQENAEDNEVTQLLGLSYYLASRPGDAVPLLEKVQAWFPRANVDAAYILGECYIQTKDYPRARQAFAKMFGLQPESAGSYLLTARMLFRQEFQPVALEYTQKALTIDPKLPLAHFLAGQIHLFQSQIDEAIADFQKELGLNPGHAETYYKLADAYSRIQKFDDAERLLQRSIWLDASSTGPYILLGKILEKKGEADLALRALQRAAAMDPNNAITHHLLGQTYRDLGRQEEADRELKLASQLQAVQDSK